LRLKVWDVDAQKMISLKECFAIQAKHAGGRRLRPATTH
jgi:hypothetical protein